MGKSGNNLYSRGMCVLLACVYSMQNSDHYFCIVTDIVGFRLIDCLTENLNKVCVFILLAPSNHHRGELFLPISGGSIVCIYCNILLNSQQKQKRFLLASVLRRNVPQSTSVPYVFSSSIMLGKTRCASFSSTDERIDDTLTGGGHEYKVLKKNFSSVCNFSSSSML